jgi:hypothetical protein
MSNIIAKHFPMGMHPYLPPLEKYILKGLIHCFNLGIGIFILAIFSGLLLQSEIPKKQNYKSGLAHIYGPVPKLALEQKNYQFDHLYFKAGTFGELPIDRISEFSKIEFQQMVLKTVPINLQERFSLVIPIAILFAEKYQVDPFWVMSVMWTESHFDQFATSKVDAKGLMQILPGTGHYITKKLGKKVSKKTIYKLINQPVVNIEFGTYYLKRLLKSFNGNYSLATMAYNMGPTGVRNRLRKNLPVGVNNLYLNKVRRAYGKISRPFRQKVENTSRPYEVTFVVAKKSNYLDYTEQMIEELWIGYLTPRVAYNSTIHTAAYN